MKIHTTIITTFLKVDIIYTYLQRGKVSRGHIDQIPFGEFPVTGTVTIGLPRFIEHERLGCFPC